ncbi:MAG: RidA family protein [Candidatus Binatia bacterium]
MGVAEKLKELGVTVPEPLPAMGSYIPAVLAGNLLFVAGHPPVENGKIKYKGKVGKDVTLEDGRHAAQLCIINCLAAARGIVGDLDQIERVVKLTGYVNCLADFEKHPDVINGASDLLEKIWGENGRHARAAVGAISLPSNIAVEVEVIFQISR